MDSPLRPEERQDPARRDLARARQTAIGQLLERGIEVSDSAGAEAVADLLEAVELFEATVASRGGDSFTNSLNSASPEDPDLTLPQPGADESVQAYTARVREKIDELRGSA